MINVGIIGCGYWGPNLIRNFYALGRSEFLMCADRDERRLQFIRQQYPMLRTTASAEELLQSKELQAVAIATPVSTHYDLAKAALLNGKDVLVEKPLAATVEQARELCRLAEDSGRILMVDHTFIYTGAVSKLKELLDEKTLGELYYIDSVRVNLGLFQHDTNVLWDLAVHDVSILDYLVGMQPQSVSALGMRHVSNGHENMAYLTAFYGNHFLAHFHVNWLAPVKVRTMLVCGNRKMAVYDDVEPSEKIKIYDKGIQVGTDAASLHNALVQYRIGDMYAPHLDGVEALKRCLMHFLDCIKQRRTPITDGQMGLRVIEVLEAAERSLREDGRRITLEPRAFGAVTGI